MVIKKSVYLGLWDNYEPGAPGRMEELQQVIDAVEEHGTVKVSFSYDGRTRHEIAANVMADMLPDDYEVEIGYNYHFVIRKVK